MIITPDQINKLLKCLEGNSSPGVDGITAEHLKFGNSHILCEHLAALFSFIITNTVVPSDFNMGIIVPILKKPCLNPNEPHNYRPITLSTTYSKLLEMCMLPPDNLSDLQFGFRKKRSTSFGCALLHDIIMHFKDSGSNLFICSLDAERCFDRIWHGGLFYKLMNIIPLPHWLFLFKWYGGLKARVKWNSTLSSVFSVTRGTRQGSVLSPLFFNIFINDLLIELYHCESGIRIGKDKYNSFAYADDLTLFSSSVTGLQQLIDKSVSYACKWRFSFGIDKTKILQIGKCNFTTIPKWCLGKSHKNINLVSELKLLGITYCASSGYEQHVKDRISAARRAIYRYYSAGWSYPGLSTETKKYLWESVGVPALTYGMDCIYLSKSNFKELESAQGSLIKQSLGLSKRSHHSALLRALDIEPVSEIIKRDTIALAKRLCQVQSPLLNLFIHEISRYILRGSTVKNSILDKLISYGVSPISILFDDPCKAHSCRSRAPRLTRRYISTGDGTADSLLPLLTSPNYNNPASRERNLVKLLTRVNE